jgi:non-specific protein-tyrosine kinase
MKSKAVATEVSRRLGDKARLVSAIHIHAVGGTRVVAITTESTNASIAREAANVYAHTYIDNRASAAAESTRQANASLLAQVQQTKAQLDDLDNRIAGGKGSAAELESLRTQRDALSAQYTAVQRQYDAGVASASVSRGVEVLAEASAANKAGPHPFRTGMFGGLIGLIVGAAAALVIDAIDDSIKTIDDVRRSARGKPVLGSVPVQPDWRDRSAAKLVTVDSPSSPAADAYRALRASLQAGGSVQPDRTILITSPGDDEGKTTVLANLGVAMARAGRRVICTDCDLRSPRLHSFFRIEPGVGFTSVLLGDSPLSKSVHAVPNTGAGSLRILTSGPLPPNPAELLDTARVSELLTAIAADADVVLVDGPPALPVPDAMTLATRVDGAIVVAAAGITGRHDLAQAIDELGERGVAVIGVVFNGAAEDAT